MSGGSGGRWISAAEAGLTVDQGWAWIYQTSPSGYIGQVDKTRGMHSFTEQKAVTASFFTDDLEGWFSYVKEIPFKSAP